MSSALQDLYRDLVLEHGRRPRNHYRPAGANHHAPGENPLCGDHLELHVRVEQGVLRELAFTGEACALARASASLMTLHLAGCELARGRLLLDEFRRLLQGDECACGAGAALEPLRAFAGVRQHPARHACAWLPWEALQHLLREAGETDPSPVRPA